MTEAPSDHEQEYFKRQELERLKRLREDAARQTAAQECQRLKDLHWMRCPKCGLELAEIAFRDVTVDTCFACGGMFFDKGEFEKAIEQKEPGFMQRMTRQLFG